MLQILVTPEQPGLYCTVMHCTGVLCTGVLRGAAWRILLGPAARDKTSQ